MKKLFVASLKYIFILMISLVCSILLITNLGKYSDVRLEKIGKFGIELNLFEKREIYSLLNKIEFDDNDQLDTLKDSAYSGMNYHVTYYDNENYYEWYFDGIIIQCEISYENHVTKLIKNDNNSEIYQYIASFND